MENHSLSKSIPQEDQLRTTKKTKNNTNMIKPQPKLAKASCKHNNRRGDHQEEEEEEEEKDNLGFLWSSSRAYTCGFCKREFRSAQALGGHMNVHRRDRAKLRRSPLLLDSTHHHYDFLGSSSQPIKFLKVYDFLSFNDGEEEESNNGECKIWKKVKKFVKEKNNNGMLGSSNEIDLELRLGF